MTIQRLQTVSAVAGELPEMPIEPSWIKEGNPVARGTVVTQSEDKKVSSGLWTCEPGKFEWNFSWDEFVHLLEGEVEMEINHALEDYEVRAGYVLSCQCIPLSDKVVLSYDE